MSQLKKPRRIYRKYKVQIDGNYMPVKQWMRLNEKFFIEINGIPTSQQIGSVLKKQGFVMSETEFEILYKKFKQSI